MNNATFRFPVPRNEEVLSYAPGSEERVKIKAELDRQARQTVEIPAIVGGKEVSTGRLGKVTMPHDHDHLLANYHKSGQREVAMAIEAALKARAEWSGLSWVDRASVMYKAAELISKKYRYLINAATMLGQSKNVYQAEIDAVCESIDFLRFGAHFASYIYEWQPSIGSDCINRVEYRPLEGFVFVVSPFNFTATALNLVTSVVLMGNVAVWKPATTSLLSNYYLMEVFKEAGIPDGVINFLPGQGSEISEVVLEHPDFAGLHFTGSTDTFSGLWGKIGQNLKNYRNYPRIVGETGGKDFVFAHPSARVEELVTALVRGAFEYQGQKCSAASRAYIPQSLWGRARELLVEWTEGLSMGDVRDFGNFVNAVIDESSFDKIMGYIEKAKSSADAKILAGGFGDKKEGYFIRPTVIEAKDPHFVTMEEEVFGPVLTIYVYKDSEYEETLKLCDETSPYALTGAIFARDRDAIAKAYDALRYAAGNFYINDKPTGAVVGQQPFGGARASGTNDKAGTHFNLMRWVSPRTVKENLLPPSHWDYPFLQSDE